MKPPNARTLTELQAALDLLAQMDDEITMSGGDDDSAGRKDLARIRRLTKHIRKAVSALAAERN
jgi:hypothetical protein